MTRTRLSEVEGLRADLKAAGYNARKVTVRRSGDSLYVTIRDGSVALSAVQPIAEAYSRVHRDERSGEILCGGNTFVTVEYFRALVEPIAARIAAVLNPAPNDIVVGLPGGYRAPKSRAPAAPPIRTRSRSGGTASISSTPAPVASATRRSASRSHTSTR